VAKLILIRLVNRVPILDGVEAHACGLVRAAEAESIMSMKDANLPSSSCDNIIAGDNSADTSTDTTTTQRQTRVRHSSSSLHIDFVPPLIAALFVAIVGIICRSHNQPLRHHALQYCCTCC
jgi:hypothetical protein